jgi:enoyl-CoA hydratase
VASSVSSRSVDSGFWITLDDGKANVLTPAVVGDLLIALDTAESTHADVVVLTGRPGAFCAGLDLHILSQRGERAAGLLNDAFGLVERMLLFPAPVVVVCTGHAVAMGAFLLLSVDYRLGVSGPYRIVVNEVANGFVVPRAGLELLRQRLTPAALSRVALLAEPLTGQGAVDAGFLDELVAPEAVDDVSRSIASRLTALDLNAHLRTKLRSRGSAVQALRSARSEDVAQLTAGAAD